MVIPPPNVTGSLHIGHALTVAIQDSIVRWNRMQGKVVLWVPGCDHAGIATQVMVEKRLWKEKKKSRHEIGREQFIKDVLHWKNEKEEEIYRQLKMLGSSLDFNRASFTMDKKNSFAVNEAFIRMFEEGMIYRQEHLVNWCCSLQSAISDIEVEHIEVCGESLVDVPGMTEPVKFGVLEMFAYPLENSEREIVVSTTRLETMLGDTALAVHPDDSRYKHFLGKYVQHPFTGQRLQVIAEESVKSEQGTGALKVTPAHHMTDFMIGKKHNLESVDILDDKGYIKKEIPIFGALPRFIARKMIREALKERGLYRGMEQHKYTIPICSRSRDIVEPRLKPQWFLQCSEQAEKAIQAVRKGELQIIPASHANVWEEWLGNIQDWCISRQLWWGHQIPAYRITNTNELVKSTKETWIAAHSGKQALLKACIKLGVKQNQIQLERDPDVLDTWYSSALFPFSVFGWPEDSEDFKQFYPLSMMETGHDILFFWVARMVMLGQKLTGKLPFSKVVLHGMLCDANGKKMSKTLGNVVDPVDVIHGISLEELDKKLHSSFEKGVLSAEEHKRALNGQKELFPNGIPQCGADSLRFALLSSNIKSQTVNFDVKYVRSCRNFCNKIWQGTRFLFGVMKEGYSASTYNLYEVHDKLSSMDYWILSQLSNLVDTCNQSFPDYNFHLATTALQDFWIRQFCDIYLESVKPTLKSTNGQSRNLVINVMLNCIHTFVRLINPYMPFLSEDLYQRLPEPLGNEKALSVNITSYPLSEEYYIWKNSRIEESMKLVLEIIKETHRLKLELGLTNASFPAAIVGVNDSELLGSLESFSTVITTLVKLNSTTFQFVDSSNTQRPGWVARVIDNKIKVFLEGQMSPRKAVMQTSQVEKKIYLLKSELEKLTRMFSDPGYKTKAPETVKESHLKKKAYLEAELQKLLTLKETSS
ncbi:valine--tRNA ligase-like isoform X2 [Tachypleus tridentatus]